MPLDADSNPKTGFHTGTVGGNPLNTEFPPDNFDLGSFLYVRDRNRLYALVSLTGADRVWRLVTPAMVLGFGASTCTAGAARTLYPWSGTVASSAGAPSATNPALVCPFNGLAFRMDQRITNAAVGSTLATVLFRNNVATTLAIAATNAATGTVTLASPVAVAAGDILACQCTATGATRNTPQVSIYLVATE